MKIIGILLCAIGTIDFIATKLEKDIWADWAGITVQQDFAYITEYMALALGYFILKFLVKQPKLTTEE